MGNFRDLKVWRLPTAVAVQTYRLTATFPYQERFGLTSQMRRAAISVSSNIAEGAGKQSTAEFRRFVSIARGSLHELQSQAQIARELNLLTGADWKTLDAQLDAISRMLLTLIRRL